MIAGELDDIMVIQQLTTDRSNPVGALVQSWADMMSVRCSVADKSGSVGVENYETVSSHNIEFTTHLRRSIKRKDMRISYRGELYRIESVLHDRQMMRTVISASLINE